jgi:hypothetical protein
VNTIQVSSSCRAASCLEAGVCFSFRAAFRESWGLVNLLQIAGRASRSGEYDNAEVWDFRHDAENGFSLHPQTKLSRRILEQIFTECAGKNRQPGPDDSTDALQCEILQDHGEKASRMEEICQAEKDEDYPRVAKLCRVIDCHCYEPAKEVLTHVIPVQNPALRMADAPKSLFAEPP